MTANKSLAVIVIVFSTFFLTLSLSLPFGTLSNLESGGWPSVTLMLLLLMGIILFGRTFYLEWRETRISSDSNKKESEEVVGNYSKKHLLIASILFIYILGVKYIGFILATWIFIAVLAFVLGMKSGKKLLLASTLSTAFFIYLFAVILEIPFPRGIGVFRELSLLFY